VPATPRTERELVETALHVSAAQLERLVRTYRGVVSTQIEQAYLSYDRRYVDWEWDEDGSLVVRVRLPVEDGALLIRAWRRRATTCMSADGDEPPSPYQIVVHVERDDVVDDLSDGCCEVEDGPALPAETARRLACDSSVVMITEHDGRPLSVGRKTRTVPPALRRALRSRNRGCRFPGCDRRRFMDAHHVQHGAHGGNTKLSNLLLLCRHHHRLVHEGGYRVEPCLGGGAAFRRPDGSAIPTVPRNRPASAHRLLQENVDAGLRITEETPVARWAGERLNYHIEIEGLLWSEGLLRLGWAGSTPEELRRGSAEPEAAGSKVLT
jgi:hypothetical protein